jgi:transcriptional regulator with XRE-family HTH domain
VTDGPWLRLAELVRLRREERHLSQRQLGADAGTTDRLISDIERAVRENYEPATLRAVARALGWTPDSIDLIKTGGDPVEADVGDASMDERMDRLEAALDRLADALSELADEVRSQRDNSARSPST